MWRRFLLLGLAVLFAFAILAQDADLKKLSKKLNYAIKKKDFDAIEETLEKIVECNNEKAAVIVLKTAIRARDTSSDIYWCIIRAISGFTDEYALMRIAKFITKCKKKGIRRDIMSSLMLNYSKSGIKAVSYVLEKSKSLALKLMAVDYLMNLSTKDVIPPLIEALKKSKKRTELRRRILKALRIVTGKSVGSNPEDWINWWEANKDTFEPPKPEKTGKGTGTAVDALDRGRNEDYEKLKRIKKEMILVIDSTWTHRPQEENLNFDLIQKILSKMKIPHEVASKEDFNDEPEELIKGRLVILINCNNWISLCHCLTCKKGGKGGGIRHGYCPPDCPDGHDPLDHAFNKDALDALVSFLNNGGYIFTEDMVYEDFLQRAFSKIFEPVTRPSPGQKPSPEEFIAQAKTIEILPAKGASGHNYLKGVFGVKRVGTDDPERTAPGGGKVEHIKHSWKIDELSPVIKVKDRNRVMVLITSKELGEKHKSDIVAVTFSIGQGDLGQAARQIGTDIKKTKGGRLLHVLSHFGKQESQVDEYTLQNLLLNFLIEAHQRYLLKKKAKKR